MIALLLALQTALAVAAAPETLHVRGVDRDTVVPVEERDGIARVRADLVVAPLGGSVRVLGEGRWTITIAGAELGVVEGAPFVRTADDVLPLAAAPVAVDGRLMVPLHLVSEIVPRVAAGVIFDPSRDELRVFNAVARRTAPASGAGPSRAPRSTRRGDGAGAVAAPAVDASGAPARTAARRRLVVIDAGHGGPDAGMHGPIGGGPQIYEKTVTLAVAKLVARELQARGYDTHLTRTRDTLIALGDRGRIANALHGDLFVSIHVNAANLAWKEPAAARGYETYFLSEAKTEDESRVERMENEAVRFETGANAPKGDPLSFIINDMAQNEHLRESGDLAATIQDAMRAVHPGPSRGVKQANFAVLRTSFMPAVLVEIGFGTNPDEADYISGAAGQRRLAKAIASGVAQYMAHYERRVGATP